MRWTAAPCPRSTCPFAPCCDEKRVRLSLQSLPSLSSLVLVVFKDFKDFKDGNDKKLTTDH